MRKILEYRVFDLLKNKDNEVFIDKVKKENPELTGKFLSILGNKGLEIAKQKYQQYDPDFIESEKKRIKKENSKKIKEKVKKFTLKKFESEILEVKNILKNSKLKEILKYIQNDKNISGYLDSFRAVKKYKNEFLDIIRKPQKMNYKFYRWDFVIDSLSFMSSNYSYYNYGDTKRESVLNIKQFYDLKTKKISYSIYFTLIDEDFRLRIDRNKEDIFIRSRNDYINKLGKTNISISELYNILHKFSDTLSEDIYDRWYKEWELKQNMNKYNL